MTAALTAAPDPPECNEDSGALSLLLRRSESHASASSSAEHSVGASDISPSLRDKSELQQSKAGKNKNNEQEADPPELEGEVKECNDFALISYEAPTNESSPVKKRNSLHRRTAQRPPKNVIGLEMVPYECAEEGRSALSPSRTSKKSSESSETMEMRRGFDHCYVLVPSKERLSVLFMTLRRNHKRKVLVFCSTCESAKFHALLFRQLGLPVHEMHKDLPDGSAAHAFDKFLYSYPGILFASDIAMREFDIPPNIDYVVQYEPPENPSEYIFRMGDALTYLTSCRKAMLFLSSDNKQETNFLTYFKNEGISIDELEARRVVLFKERVEKMTHKHHELNKIAWNAFRAFSLAYESHSFKNIYSSKDFNRDRIRRSFGHPHPPGYKKEQTDRIGRRLPGVSKTDKNKKENTSTDEEESYRNKLCAPVSSTEKERNNKVRRKKKKKELPEEHVHSRWKKECSKEHCHSNWKGDLKTTWRSKKKESWMAGEKSWTHSKMKVQEAK